ncbi:hypothetical protein CH35J_010112 [Colletotrichum higginsianum]|uniref:Uncharacterized protein n=1 Tax=Colletotrichum higginsianum TaxID=80884 RepID=A0A4T0VKH4_9PEZI|nr:hypothetical protein CH35J_010112 [Colletotrichum higginsianum]
MINLVIIPFVGPPQICFGCIVKFPPNIKIDIPEFCIQLLGLKIGNCPPKKNKDGEDDDKDDDKNDDEDDNNDKDDDDDKSKSKTRTKTHSSTATTTSSSCTATVTATQKSIFCSVARACAIKKIERSEDSAAQGLVRRGDPSLGKWPDPSDHENHESFIVSQIDAIAEDTAKKERYTPKLVEHGPNDGPSANWTTFKDNVEAIGLEGLFGCTSIVLVSRKGAWISHIWQTTMDPEEEDLDEDDSTMDPFEHLIEVELPNRIPPDMEFYKFYEYGLNDMKDHPEDGDAGVMFGNSKDGATDTPTSLNMKAFIVTPRKWTYPEVYFDARGRRIPHQVLAHVDFRKGTVRYPDQVRALQTAVTEVYGDIPVEVVDYNPTIVRPENWAAFQWTGKLIVNGELMPIPEYHGRLSRRNVRGKILLQYQPAATCQDEAEWRLWVEGQPAGDRADKWPPLPGQIFSSSSEPDKSDPSDEKDPSDKKVERRQVCELPNKSKNPISATPASVGVSASPPVSQGGSSKRAGIEVTLSRNGSMASQTLTSLGTGFLPTSTLVPGEHFVVFLFFLFLPFLSLANQHIGHHNNLVHKPGKHRYKEHFVLFLLSLLLLLFFVASQYIGHHNNLVNKPDKHRVDKHYVLLFSLLFLLLLANHHIGHHKNLINFNLLHTRTMPTMPTTVTPTKTFKPATTPSKDTLVVIPIKDNPTTSQKPVPAPSEAVAIFYTETLAPDDDDGKKLLREGAWYMFPVMAADAANFDPCNKYPMGHLQLHEPLNLNSVPWPPPIDGEKPFFDRRKCKYKGGNGSRGFGKMSCDDVPEFDCESDPRAKKLLECESHPKAEQSFKPRILRKFPVLEPAGRTQNMKDAVGQP